MIRPILFLDFDGVLVTPQSPTAHHADPACVAELNRIIRETRCQIVVTSSWRQYGGDQSAWLTTFGVDLTPIKNSDGFAVSATPSLCDDDHRRSDEILAWLEQTRERCRLSWTYPPIVVLDDHYVNLPYLVQTDPKTGITPAIADKVILGLCTLECPDCGKPMSPLMGRCFDCHNKQKQALAERCPEPTETFPYKGHGDAGVYGRGFHDSKTANEKWHDTLPPRQQEKKY